tara:strand:- start:784 stop:951 length:168 start_codon:yes stop_codon:yes gene_type:complete
VTLAGQIILTGLLFWVFFIFASPIKTLTLTVWALAIPLGIIGLGLMGYILVAIWS